MWQGLGPHQATPVVGPQSVSGCLKSLYSCASSQLPSAKVWIKRSLRRKERSGASYTGWMWINTTKLPLGSRGLNLALLGEEGETVILYKPLSHCLWRCGMKCLLRTRLGKPFVIATRQWWATWVIQAWKTCLASRRGITSSKLHDETQDTRQKLEEWVGLG